MTNILIVSPHFQTFVREQARIIQESSLNVTAMVPIPRFSNIVPRIPGLGRPFRFVDWALESHGDGISCFVTPRFFTLPVNFIRRRNQYLISKSCMASTRSLKAKPDLAHIHFLDMGYVGLKMKEELGIPLVITGHGADVYGLPTGDDWSLLMAKRNLRAADIVISVSHFNAAILRRLGLPSKKLHVIPNGFDHKRFKPLDKDLCRTYLGLPSSKYIILSIGRLSPEKGHNILLHAYAKAIRSLKNSILVIVGSGMLRENLEQTARKLNIANSVRFIGHVEHTSIPIWINASDVFVLPSLSESFPTVIPETLGCGRPVLATHVGGVPEAIDDVSKGIVVPPNDVHSLHDGLLLAHERKWMSTQIAKSAQNLSWAKLVPRILDIYHELLRE